MAVTDTENQENKNGTGNGDNNQGRTFTQDEVNAIIAERLKKESSKYSDYEALKDKASKFDELEEANKSELQKATEKALELQKKIDSMTKENEIRSIRDKVAKETGVPATLLNGTTEEACTEQAKGILAFKGSDPYPEAKDGGEARKPGGKKVEDQFADWFAKSLG